jgi:hypothetical protein
MLLGSGSTLNDACSGVAACIRRQNELRPPPPVRARACMRAPEWAFYFLESGIIAYDTTSSIS